MTKLTLTMSLSLDGVYQAPGEPGEDRSDGFDKGGWQVPYVDDDTSALRLVNSQPTSTGVLINNYQPGGKPVYGDFGLEPLGQTALENFSQGIVDLAAEARRRQR